MSQLKLNSEDKKIVKEFMRGLVGNKFNVSKLYMHEDLQFDDEDLKLQFSDTNKNSRHRNASHFSVPAVFGRIGYHSAKLWHQARKSAGERPVFRSFPSTRAASGERLFFKAAAVSPNPLPPEVANRMTLFPEKS